MRIGLFSDTFPPDVNGVAISVLTLQQALIKHGHDVFVVATHPSLIHTQKDGNILRLPGVEIKKLYGYAVAQPFHIFAINEIAAMNLDIIHVHTEFGVGTYARMISQALKIPIVGTYHTTYEDYTHYVIPTRFKKINQVAKKTVAKFSKIAGDSCLEMITPSEKTKELLENYQVCKPISVIPTGIDLERFDPKNTSTKAKSALLDELGLTNKFVILFVGRIAAEKSIDVIIKAMDKIVAKNKDAHLLVVGGGPSLDEYKELAKSLGVNNSTTFLGKVASSDIPKYYHLADAFVSASVTETQGLTFVEALASGLVVFASDPEVVKDIVLEDKTGYLFDGPEDLAEKMNAYIATTSKKKVEMRKRALTIVDDYGSEVFYQRVIKVYERVVSTYHDLYKIVSIDYAHDCISINLKNSAKKLEVMVSVKTYYDLGIRKDQVITNELVEHLLAEQEKVQAYYRCLRKIRTKDRTTKEIYDFLTHDTKLDIKSINEIVNDLEAQGFINDRRYAFEYVDKKDSLLMGEHKIIHNLKKKGINIDLIREAISRNEGASEEDNALAYANKVAITINGRSLNEKQLLIKRRLYNQGFNEDVINKAMLELNFNDDLLSEMNNLEKIARKAYSRYKKKYKGSNLRNYIFRYLALKGYRYEDIYIVLDKMEFENEN